MEYSKCLTCLCPPFLHVLKGGARELNQLRRLLKENPVQPLVKLINGLHCKTKDALFDEWAAVMAFPSYFGHNWEAFDECLNDLQWLPAPAYVVIIKHFDKVLDAAPHDKKVLITLLQKTADAWAHGQHYGALIRNPTPFHVVFQSTEQTSLCIKPYLLQTSIHKV